MTMEEWLLKEWLKYLARKGKKVQERRRARRHSRGGKRKRRAQQRKFHVKRRNQE